jgi:hypothetical protein
MAEFEMFDYLPDMVADYTAETLSIHPHEIMPEEGDKNQVVHEFDDGSIDVVPISDQDYFTVKIQWSFLAKSIAGTIRDLWHNTAKANGRENTFYWEHPTDGHVYVARFMTPIRYIYRGGHPNDVDVGEVTLRIEGRKAEA